MSPISRRQRRSLDDLLKQVSSWDRRHPITDAQAEARLGKGNWQRVKAHLQQRGEMTTRKTTGGTTRRIEATDVKRERQWVRGLLKVYIHYRGSTGSSEFEVEFDDVVVPRGITTKSKFWRQMRERMMTRVEGAMMDDDPVFANFIGTLPFAEREAALEIVAEVPPQKAIVWRTTTVRALRREGRTGRVWQKRYSGGRVGGK